MKWKIVDRSLCYQDFFRLEKIRLRHNLYNGGWSEVLVRELIHRSDAVAVLPYDPGADKVVLIEQFRTGAIDSPQGPWLVEIVAGFVEAVETRVHAATREIQEEISCEPLEFLQIYNFYASPGGFKERVSLYVARIDVRELHITYTKHHDEDIRVLVVGAHEAFDLIASGVITSATPIIALQWLQLNHTKLREQWS
jgi:ADP-ribose pyrophosphatase